MRRFLVPIVIVPLASVASLSASGGDPFMVYQPPIAGAALASQDFTNLPAYSCSCLDDFTITEPLAFATLRIFGLEESADGASLNLDVRARILLGPDLEAPTVAVLHGSQVGEDLVFDLEGLVLGAGTYWLSAQVIRPFIPSQQWLWSVSATVNGAEAVFHNPGGGFDLGTAPFPISVLEDGMHDMAFRLEAVPAPGVLAAFAMAGLAARRRLS